MVPYAIAVSHDGRRLYISNWGGRRPEADDTTAKSSGSVLVVDEETGIVNTGSVSVVDLQQQELVATIMVGLHPCGLCLSRDGTRLFVANANSDTVNCIDTATLKVFDEISVKADDALPLGSAPNALALDANDRRLYVALGGNNAIAVVIPGSASSTNTPGSKSKLEGLIPTGWYPGSIMMDADGRKLLVANTKGIGSLDAPNSVAGHNSTQYLGTLSIIDLPDTRQLAQW